MTNRPGQPISTWPPDQYQLLDFGEGRKLERFGRLVLDRPCPAAAGATPESPAAWLEADVKWNDSQQSRKRDSTGPEWEVAFGELKFQLKLTPFGHVGLFPEQATNWLWLQETIQAWRPRRKTAIRALNLFAYTGGTTLALASAGAEVVHVDASSPAVSWARKNALASGLQESPIRWIVEDARKFVARELRRGNRYDVVVLDPPSYGHGPTGKRWEIERDLEPLLEQCGQLRTGSDALWLVTAHSAFPDQTEVARWMGDLLGTAPSSAQRLRLRDPQGRMLDAGFVVRHGGIC